MGASSNPLSLNLLHDRPLPRGSPFHFQRDGVADIVIANNFAIELAKSRLRNWEVPSARLRRIVLEVLEAGVGIEPASTALQAAA